MNNKFLLIIIVILLVALYASSFHTNKASTFIPDKQGINNTALDACIATAVKNFDDSNAYLDKLAKDCYDQGRCNLVEPKMIEAREIGNKKLFDELKKQKEICEIKY